MPSTIDDQELRTALANRLRDWKQTGNTLERTFQFADFRTAMAFVNKVADEAELIQHHPDITINYNKVRMTLSSHDAGGITRRDLDLAGRINEVAPVFEDRRKTA